MKSFSHATPCQSSADQIGCAASSERADGLHSPRRRARRRSAVVVVPSALQAFEDLQDGLGADVMLALEAQAEPGMGLDQVLHALGNLEKCVDDLSQLRDRIRDEVLPRMMQAKPAGARAATLAARAERAALAPHVDELLRPRVLHVDTDDDGAATLAALISPEARITHVRSMAEARVMLRHDHFELVVLDPELPDGDGQQLLDDIGQTPLLVHARRHAAWHARADGFLIKPWSSQRQIWQTVARMLGIEFEQPNADNV